MSDEKRSGQVVEEEMEKPRSEGFWLGSQPPSSHERVNLESQDLVAPARLTVSPGAMPPPPIPSHLRPPGAGVPGDLPTASEVPAADDGPDATSQMDFERRYDYRKPLGAGGMGIVKLYRDLTVGRDVAMKVARPGTPQSGGAAHWRFVREARVQGQLEHPAVLPVYDLGIDPDGSVYFTMKRLRGLSLTEVLDALRREDPDIERRFSLRKRLSLFNQLCLAIDFTHSRGVIHRDLKPDNVMIGDFGEVYLLDWGLAKVGGSADLPTEATVDDADGAGKTRDGEMLGTPGYMAPEQMRGRGNVDERADVYALGALLFELLTLEPLHAGDNLGAVMHSTGQSDGLHPAERTPDRDIPPELDELCYHATRQDPEHRPPSARELSRAVEAYLDGDRDHALREELSVQHAEAAAAALERANGDGDEASERGRAMREVTAALGLDPDNPLALRTLVRLFTEPPKTTPPEAEAEMRAMARDGFRAAGRSAIWVYLGFILYVPLVLWMGIRSWPAFFALGGSILASLLATLYYLKRPPDDLRAPLPHLLLANLTVAVSSVLLGPLVLVPLLAFANAVAYLSSTTGRRRLIVLLSVLAVAIPAALEWGGFVPASYRVAGDVLEVLPGLMHFPELPTRVFLVVANIALVASGGLYVANLRTRYVELERRLQLQAWQLRQAVPETAREVMDG